MPQAHSDAAPDRRARKVRQGVVVSSKMTKSIVVRVSRTVRHPIYQKVIQRSKKYMAHCEDPSVKEGDVVRIMECRPLSRNKRWRLLEVVRRSEEQVELKESALNPV
jgi:small subunit ribosomal protein S17